MGPGAAGSRSPNEVTAAMISGGCDDHENGHGIHFYGLNYMKVFVALIHLTKELLCIPLYDHNTTWHCTKTTKGCADFLAV